MSGYRDSVLGSLARWEGVVGPEMREWHPPENFLHSFARCRDIHQANARGLGLPLLAP